MKPDGDANNFLIIILVVVISVLGVLFLVLPKFRTQVIRQEVGQTQKEEMVGGDRDEHGCIGSAGYTWCEAKAKCLRTWEEECESIEMQIKRALVEKHGENANKLTVSVAKTEGDFAQGGASEQGMGGGMWFAAKVDGEWKLVWDGNGVIGCEALSNYQDFPVSLIPSCFDTQSRAMLDR